MFINIYMSYIKQTECKYCKISFNGLNPSQRANHSRWCEQNPKKSLYKEKLSYTRNCITTEGRKRQSQWISAALKEGLYNNSQQKTKENPPFKGHHHTEEVKEKIRQLKLADKRRRLRKYTISYKGILMDSGWEVELAKRLDSLNINWIRPEPIPWRDKNNIVRNYFPDFYLPDYDIYIDPKNPIAYKSQIEKIKALHEQYKNIIILTNLKLIQEFDISSYNGTVS